jgi:hypothetical protein
MNIDAYVQQVSKSRQAKYAARKRGMQKRHAKEACNRGMQKSHAKEACKTGLSHWKNQVQGTITWPSGNTSASFRGRSKNHLAFLGIHRSFELQQGQPCARTVLCKDSHVQGQYFCKDSHVQGQYFVASSYIPVQWKRKAQYL